MVYCIYCGLNRLELQAKHQLHGRAPVPAARPSLFTLFNYLEFSWAFRRAHDVQTLLRTRESTACSPPRTNPLKTEWKDLPARVSIVQAGERGCVAGRIE